MGIFAEQVIERTHLDRIDDFSVRRPSVTFEVDKTGVTRPSIDRTTEYVLRVTAAQNFWANSAQYQDAETAARQSLATFVYADVLSEVDFLILAIESGDRRTALESALRLKGIAKVRGA